MKRDVFLLAPSLYFLNLNWFRLVSGLILRKFATTIIGHLLKITYDPCVDLNVMVIYVCVQYTKEAFCMFLFQLVFRTVSQLEHTTIMNKKWFVGAIVLFRIKMDYLFYLMGILFGFTKKSFQTTYVLFYQTWMWFLKTVETTFKKNIF